jgi:CheY-like chemotaxis protein
VPAVVAAVQDLLFCAKLRETAGALGVALFVVPSAPEVAACVREHRPALLIVDLHWEACGPLELVRAIRADPEVQGTRVLGYYAHVRDDVRAAAAEAGVDELLPRSAFSARLPEILGRYAAAAEA